VQRLGERLVVHTHFALRFGDLLAGVADVVDQLAGFFDAETQAAAGVGRGARVVRAQGAAGLEDLAGGASAATLAADDEVLLLVDEAGGHLEFLDDGGDVSATDLQLFEGLGDALAELREAPFGFAGRARVAALLPHRLVGGTPVVDHAPQPFQLLQDRTLGLFLDRLLRFAVGGFLLGLFVEQFPFRDLARFDPVGEVQQVCNREWQSEDFLTHVTFAGFDLLGDLDLLLACQQRDGAHFLQVHSDRVGGVFAEALLLPFLFDPLFLLVFLGEGGLRDGVDRFDVDLAEHRDGALDLVGGSRIVGQGVGDIFERRPGRHGCLGGFLSSRLAFSLHASLSASFSRQLFPVVSRRPGTCTVHAGPRSLALLGATHSYA